MRRTIGLLLVFMLCVTLLAGCGGGGGDNGGLSGKYVLTSMEMDGEDLSAIYAEMGMSMESMYLEFKGGGKCTIAIMDEAGEGTFKVDGKTVTVSADGEELFKGTIEGNKIIVEEEEDPESAGYSSSKMVFEKK